MNIRKTIIKAIVALTLVAVIAPVSTSALTVEELQAQINLLMAQLATLQGTTTTTTTGVGAPAVCAGITFSRNMTIGATGADVKCLQAILNQSPTTQVATTGAGSPGNETTYFGGLTLAAVKVFQSENGMTPANQVGPMTRARLNAILAGGTTGETVNPPVVVPTGTVSATLAYDNPAAGTLVVNQGLATLAKFQLTGTGTVTAVTLKRVGVSADTTLSNVYLFDGATRLTDSASVSGGSTITFSGLNIAVSGSKVLTVKSTIAGTAGETVGVQLTGVTLSSGTVSGTPVSANLFSLSSATLAGVALGTALPSSSTTTDPENDVRVWENTFTVSNREVSFTRLALRQVNSINSADIRNFRLFIDGTQVATAELDADKYVTFVFNKTLATGSRNVKVLADVIGGSSYYIEMSMRMSADIEVTDSQYGVNITPSGTIPSSASTIQVNAGTMTVEKATDSPSGNVVNAASDVVLAKYTFKANGEPIKVETLLVDFTHYTSGDVAETSTLRNGRIMVNGSQVGSTTTLNPADTGTSFSTNFIVNPGSPATVEVRADMFDNDDTNAVSDGDKFTVTLSQGSSNAEKRVSYGRLNVPSANVSANQVTVAQGTISLARQSNYANQTTVVPQTGYKLAAYNLAGNSSEDVNVHTISVDFTSVSGTAFSYADLSNVYVKYGTQTTTTKSTVAATSNSWSVNNFTLAKNATVPVEIYATIGSTIDSTNSIKSTTTITGLTALSAQSAATSETDGQTISYGAGSLTGTKDGSSLVASIVSGNTNVDAASYSFTAVNDTYKISKLTFTISDSTTLKNVNLMKGATLIATAPAASTVVFNLPTGDATDPKVVQVTPSEQVVLKVNLEVGNVGTGAGTSGSNIKVTLGADSEAIAGSTGIQADMTIGTGAGNNVYAYKTVPTITNQTLPSSVLSAGTLTLSKFQVSSPGTIGWKDIIFSVTKTGGSGKAAIGTTNIYNEADQNTSLDTCTVTNGGATDTTATITCTVATEEYFSGSRTYVLKSAISGTPATSDVISTSIGQTNPYVAPTDYTTVNGTTAEFVWTDRSAQSHSESTTDWNNGYLVKTLPTDAQTLTR